MSKRDLSLKLIFSAVDRSKGTVKGIGKNSAKMARELKQAQTRLKGLQAAAKNVTAFKTLKRSIKDSERALKAKQRAVDELAREIRDAERPTARLTQRFAKAKREASSAKDAYKRQQSQLEGLRRSLRDTGISTNDLAGSERRLRREMDKTNAEIAQRKTRLANIHKLQARGAKLRGAGLGMTAGVSVPVALMGGQAFQAAMDAQELQSAYEQTFKGNAAQMNAWAEATGDALGRSTSEMKRGANQFGLFFNEVAPPKRAAAMAKEFAVLAQDLESFHNLRPGQGIEKLRSGLAGQSEPLQALGIMLNETQVKAKAAAMGLEAVKGKLTEEQKIAARRALILEKTRNAQGDVMRTRDSSANQLRENSAEMQEFQEAVGTKLLPALTPLIKAGTQLLEGFNQLSPEIQTIILGIVGLVAVLGPLLAIIGSVVAGFGAIAAGVAAISAPIWGAIAIIAAIVAALGIAAYLIYQHWDTITEAFWSAVDWVSNALGKIRDALVGAFDFWMSLHKRALLIGKNIVIGLAKGIMAAPKAVWNALKKVVMGGIKRVKKWLGIASPSRVFMEIGKHTAQGLALGIDRKRGKPISAMRKLAGGIVSAGAIAVASPGAADSGNRSPFPPHDPRGPGPGAGAMTININIYQQPGEGSQDLADRVYRKIEEKMGKAARGSYEDDV